MILANGLDDLDYSQRRQVKKYLSPERVEELLKQREAPEEYKQLGIFDAA